MALLKKIKSATLMEAIVATILIVVIFVISSLVLNNLLFNTFNKNTNIIDNRISELQYSIKSGLLKIPYKEQFNNWNIEIRENVFDGKIWYTCSAVNKNNKQVTKSILYAN